MEKTKTCCNCKQEKWVSEFGAKRKYPDGLNYRCKVCEQLYHKESKERKQNLVPEYKTCVDCHSEKPKAKFFSSATAKDSLSSRCKSCFYQRRKERYDKHRSDHNGYKVCASCLVEKNVTEFCKANQYDGYYKFCNSCVSVKKAKSREQVRYKTCSSCQLEKNATDFYKDKTTKDGLASTCKECTYRRRRAWQQVNHKRMRFYTAKYRATKHQAIPSWADQELLDYVYQQCPEGYDVDHIIPLQGTTVCGLHTPENLQYLPSSENSSKNNSLSEEYIDFASV